MVIIFLCIKVHTKFETTQRLEHIGFALNSIRAVNQLFNDLQQHGFNIAHPPKTFGIDTHSFSVFDPDGIEVEFIYHPSMWVKP